MTVINVLVTARDKTIQGGTTATHGKAPYLRTWDPVQGSKIG